MRTPTLLLLLCAAPLPAAAQRGELAFALSFGEDSPAYVVLSDPSDESWAYGPIRLIETTDLTVVSSRRIDRARLPAELAERLDERWTAYDQSGLACGGNLGEPIELRLLDGQFIDEDRSANDLAQNDDPYTRVLAAPIEAVCGLNVMWAHPEGRSPSAFYAPRARLSDEEREEAVAALRALPAYAEIQTEYDEWIGDEENYVEDPTPAEWDAYDGGVVHAARIEDRRGERELVIVSAQVGYGCGVFIGNLWAVFERNAEGALVLVGERREERPIVLMDLEGDGTFERLTWDGLLEGDQMREIQRDPWFCPC